MLQSRQLHVGCVLFPLSRATAATEGQQASNQTVLVSWLVSPDPAGDSVSSQDRHSGRSKKTRFSQVEVTEKEVGFRGN